jgi:hypothetical protein
MGIHKSTNTSIVPRDHPRVEMKDGDEVFDADDARAMSPRRSSQDLEKIGQEARAQLNEYAPVPSHCLVIKLLTSSLGMPRSLKSRS